MITKKSIENMAIKNLAVGIGGGFISDYENNFILCDSAEEMQKAAESLGFTVNFARDTGNGFMVETPENLRIYSGGHVRYGKPTAENMEYLKKDWLKDPNWDICETEGFEEYKDELTAFQKQIEHNYEQKKSEEFEIEKEEANKLGLHGLYRLIKDIKTTQDNHRDFLSDLSDEISVNTKLDLLNYFNSSKKEFLSKAEQNDIEPAQDHRHELENMLNEQNERQQKLDQLKIRSLELNKGDPEFIGGLYKSYDDSHRWIEYDPKEKKYRFEWFEEGKHLMIEPKDINEYRHGLSYADGRKNEFANTSSDTLKKIGYVQGVCECIIALGDNQNLGKKLLTEMNVTKDMAKKYASPETYKTLEKGIFAPKPEQKLEQTQGVKR